VKAGEVVHIGYNERYGAWVVIECFLVTGSTVTGRRMGKRDTF